MFSPICMLALLAAVAHRLTGTGVGTDAVLAVRVGAVFFGQTAAHRGSSQDEGLLRTVGWATAGDYSLDLLGELQPHACWVILKVATSCSVAVVRTVQAWQCCSNEGIAVCKPCPLFVGSRCNARPIQAPPCQRHAPAVVAELETLSSTHRPDVKELPCVQELLFLVQVHVQELPQGCMDCVPRGAPRGAPLPPGQVRINEEINTGEEILVIKHSTRISSCMKLHISNGIS